MRDALVLIADERERQQSVEGWTAAHDDEHTEGALADAAICYAADPEDLIRRQQPPLRWPWSEDWWKPGDRIGELVKAGALIVAEIERLQRAQA